MSTDPNNTIDYSYNYSTAEFPSKLSHDLTVNPKPMLIGFCKPRCRSEKAIQDGCVTRAKDSEMSPIICKNRYFVWIECIESCVQPALYGLLKKN